CAAHAGAEGHERPARREEKHIEDGPPPPRPWSDEPLPTNARQHGGEEREEQAPWERKARRAIDGEQVEIAEGDHRQDTSHGAGDDRATQAGSAERDGADCKEQGASTDVERWQHGGVGQAALWSQTKEGPQDGG